jgi:transcriptional regulator with XRE-family HTH domain
VDSHIKKGVAYQIRAIRDRLKWSQERLAGEVRMPQNAISRLESPDYGKPTLTTLRRLAAAFDVGLVVRFVPFTEMVDWVSGTPRVNRGLSDDSLAVPGFDVEESLGLLDSQAQRIYQVSTGGALTRQLVAPRNTVIVEVPTGRVHIDRKPSGRSGALIPPITTGDGGGVGIWKTS